MGQIPRQAYEKWESATPCEYIYVSDQGRQVDCIVVVRNDAPDRMWNAIDTVNCAIEPSSVAHLSVAVRSYSAMPRVLIAQGSASSLPVGFDCRPDGTPNEFDLEIEIPKCRKLKEDAVYYEVTAPIKSDGSEPEEPLEIVADVEVVRGDNDDLVRKAVLILSMDSE